ncbi:response regulator transcription factor [Cohnella caldifontis]|uniref:response regulator transcription factor n=1 Tax=Cohnella caldifontis TaxID=3027471 RepID=UPI0023EBDAF0|nr:response regulator [Cohnella sp. YIM B05605]
MLVVDDEIYALRGITQGIDWSDLPFAEILEADSVDAALAVLTGRQVDLVISDIEMPGANGLTLLRWMQEHRPETVTVFLTGHARFDYAQEALHLGAFDYVLKPIDHDVLKGIVGRAVREIQERRQRQDFEHTLGEYRRQWSSQLPILVERFWQDLLANRLPLSPGLLRRQFELYGIPLGAEDGVQPVLISIEQWDVELDARDENIMEYAIRKAAAETILAEWPGAVLQDRSDLNLLLLYLPDGVAVDRAVLHERCRQYVTACRDYFHCRVSCYLGESVRVDRLADELERLQQAERVNTSTLQAVIDIRNAEGEASVGSGFTLPPFGEWGLLLDGGRTEELSKALADYAGQFRSSAPSRETLELFYFGFVHMLFQVAYRKGVSVYHTINAADLNAGQSLRTHQQLLAWALDLIQKAGDAFQGRQRDVSAIISKIQSFIQDNLHREMSRDEIAAAVYRNPAYVSRLFRKETGMSLWDYITHAKIERAKERLAGTNDKISDIASELGYTHFSYFAKLFRKMTGATPQDYRKNHRAL